MFLCLYPLWFHDPYTSNPQLQMDGLPSGCEAAYTQCGFNYIPTYTPSPLPTTMNNPDMLSMPLLDYMDNSEPMTLPNQPVTPLSIPTVTPHVTRPKKDTKRAKLTQINKNVSWSKMYTLIKVEEKILSLLLVFISFYFSFLFFILFLPTNCITNNRNKQDYE